MNPIALVFDLDILILDKVAQPAVNWLGRRYGVDAPNLGMNIGYIAIGIMITEAFNELLLRWWSALVVDGVTTPMFAGALWMARHIARGRGVNYNRAGLAFWRVWGVLGTVIVLPFLFFLYNKVNFYIAAENLFLTIGFYILSCQRPPPKEQREMKHDKWMEPAMP